MLPYPEQKTLVLRARHSVSPDNASIFFRSLNELVRQGQVSYSVRNQVRAELKARGCSSPRRAR